jgi:hypothetical protein
MPFPKVMPLWPRPSLKAVVDPSPTPSPTRKDKLSLELSPFEEVTPTPSLLPREPELPSLTLSDKEVAKSSPLPMPFKEVPPCPMPEETPAVISMLPVLLWEEVMLSETPS